MSELTAESNQLVGATNQLKLATANGKKYRTVMADTGLVLNKLSKERRENGKGDSLAVGEDHGLADGESHEREEDRGGEVARGKS